MLGKNKEFLKNYLNSGFCIIGCRQIGLLLGPCFTILLKQMKFSLFGIEVTMYNSPGLLMAILWIILAVLAFFFFVDLPVPTVRLISIKKSISSFD